MILAAGQGTRLGALGRSIAKVLVPVGSKPLLERHLEYLAREGFTRVVVNAHHLADQIVSFVDGYRGPLAVSVVVEEAMLGTAGGVRNALEVIGDGSVLVLYGDVLIDEPLAPLWNLHRRSEAIATLLVHEEPSAEGKGVVRIDADGRVTGFEEKTHTGPGPALVNSGVYAIEPELLTAVPAGRPWDFGHDLFPAALARGARIFGYRSATRIIDIGTPEGLARARAALGKSA